MRVVNHAQHVAEFYKSMTMLLKEGFHGSFSVGLAASSAQDNSADAHHANEEGDGSGFGNGGGRADDNVVELVG